MVYVWVCGRLVRGSILLLRCHMQIEEHADKRKGVKDLKGIVKEEEVA